MSAGQYTIRILSRDGTVDIKNLPHLHCRYSVYGYQGGISGTAQGQLGESEITLFGPQTPDGKRWFQLYSQLDFLQRVEIYAGPYQGQSALASLSDTQFGPLLFSGIIMRRHTTATTDTLTVADSLQLLALTHKFIPVRTNAPADTILNTYGLTGYTSALSEDFAGGLTGWTSVAATAGTWSAATLEGYTGARFVCNSSGSVMAGTLKNNTAFTPTDGSVLIFDAIVTMAGVGGFTPNLGVYVGNAAPGSGTSIEAIMEHIGPTAANQVNSFFGFLTALPGGTATDGSVIVALSPKTPLGLSDGSGNVTLRYQCQVVFQIQDSGGFVPCEMLVNGYQVGVVNAGSAQTNYNPPSRLKPGAFVNGNLFLHITGSATSGDSFFITNVCWLNKKQLFNLTHTGTVHVVNNPPWHEFNGSSNLDIVHTMLNQEQWVMRKNPQIGWDSDNIDAADKTGANVYSDSQVRFAEGLNVVSYSQAPNFQQAGSMVVAQGGANSRYIAFKPSLLTKYGVLTRQHNHSDVTNVVGLRGLGAQAVGNMATFQEAAVVEVDDSATEGRWREMDTAIFHMPSQGVVESRKAILGYSAEEYNPVKTLYVEQFGT